MALFILSVETYQRMHQGAKNEYCHTGAATIIACQMPEQPGIISDA
jgi:hypothetical protein